MDYLYYHPENYGLKVVAETEWTDFAYGFDLTVVWVDESSGLFYMADDSGCSCPTPFSDFHRGNITPIENLQQLIDHVESRIKYSRQSADYLEGQKAKLIQAYRDTKKNLSK